MSEPAKASSADTVRLISITLGVSLAAIVAWFGGLRGFAYAVLYGLALVPGLPLGWRLFGRRHPAGWAAGALVGYGLSSIAFWVPIGAGVPRALAFATSWAVAAGCAWAIIRGRDALVDLPPWTRRDTVAWLLVLQLVVGFLALPFGKAGARDAAGRRYYRAYFTADFVWHTALTEEVARFDSPPRNPYFGADPVHYYWTYYVVPAVLGGPLVGVEAALKITAAGQALLMFSLVFMAAWSAAAGRAGPAAAASVVALMAPSYEGLYKTAQYLARGVPLDALRDLNIDAISAWDFHGLRIDGLVRSMWYTPQHETSFALGLVGVLVASRMHAATRWPAFLLTGIALALSVAMNPFLGAAFCAIYGLTLLHDVVLRRMAPAQLAQQVLAVAPVAAALVWCLANQMGASTGGHVFFGWLHDARAPLLTLFLSLGGLLLPAATGCGLSRRVPWRPALPAVPGLLVGLGLLYFVSLSDRSWVGFRAGNILQVTLPMLAARGFAILLDAGSSRLLVAVVVALLLTGAPTTLIDTYNAQDIANLRQGPGFKWTLVLSPGQQAGFEWLRHSTLPEAIVQADPVPRVRQNWSVIPTFAGRRMAAGIPISLLPEPHQEGLPERVHALITRLPLARAHAEARALSIDYLWLDGDDEGGRQTRERFRARPDLFTPVFQQGDVAIYRVRQD